MKLNKIVLSTLMATSLYAANASAGIMCEYAGNGASSCEAITNNSQQLNTYTWSLSGFGSVTGSGPFATAICLSSPCSVKVNVTYPNGSSSNWSKTIQGPSNSGGFSR